MTSAPVLTKISSDERDQGNVLKSLLRKIIIKYKSNPLWVKPLSFVFGADRRPFPGGEESYGSLQKNPERTSWCF